MTAALFSGRNLAKRSSIERLLLAGFMALAFFFQGYATQTHIHKQTDGATSIVSKVDGSSRPSKVPDNDDPANCPICQQISHAGQYVAPTWLLSFLILAAVSTIEIVNFSIPRFDAVSHSWRGRGPPLN
jgi:hypothetical protein